MTAMNHFDSIATGAVSWFTLSLVNAALAQNKGRSECRWWVSSLFLGPICTLLLLALDSDESDGLT